MNVILIIIDSLRKDHIGDYGNRWILTPNMDALAADSLRFDGAYPESLPSIPARRAIHTGLRTWPFRDWHRASRQDVNLYGWQPVPDDQTTLAEILHAAGYATMFVTDTLHQFRPGYNFHRGFDVFHFIRGQERDLYRPASLCPEGALKRVLLGGPKREHATRIMRQYLANTRGRRREEDWFAPRVFLRAMEFLESARKAQPFFLLVDAYDPHEPWDPPGHYVRLYDEDYRGPEPQIASSGDSGWLKERQLKRMRALYAAEVTMVDRWLGSFLDRAQELHLLEETLVILLSDHGHAFGEHGIAGKVPSALYPELLDIPLFLRHPEGRGAGRSTGYPASTHDVAPTILGAVGLEPPYRMDGVDLTPLLEGDWPAQERPHLTAGYHDHAWARDEDYALIVRRDGSEPRLFDLREDPDQTEDVSRDRPEVVKRMFEEYILADAGGPLPAY
ncbi:Arylsulfatase [Rubrobacter xylanophilus DSM 9941]|uniref:sulfatase n=1 Tax=Rubrobacter xylanophilus TaxID=49319 RepID=UPI001C63DE05|nr:sulfatase [Rubrobacter xylanophilus]QYJ14478.1 Arylsulfatase [Rubrobacter xylanophilus DSM 9941]